MPFRITAKVIVVLIVTVHAQSVVLGSTEDCEQLNGQIWRGVFAPSNENLDYHYKVCLEARAKLENEVRKYKAARKLIESVDPITAKIHVDKIDRIVSNHAMTATKLISDISQLKIDLSTGFNKEYTKIRKSANNVDVDIKNIEKNWDEINLLPDDNPIWELEALLHSQILKINGQELLTSVERWLNQLPDYLLGSSPAPREKLNVLLAILDNLDRQLYTKKYLLHEHAKASFGRLLAGNLMPILIESRSKDYLYKLLDVTGAENARAEILESTKLYGICYGSRAHLNNILEKLRRGFTHAPQTVQEHIEEELEEKISNLVAIRDEEVGVCGTSQYRKRMASNILHLLQGTRLSIAGCEKQYADLLIEYKKLNDQADKLITGWSENVNKQDKVYLQKLDLVGEGIILNLNRLQSGCHNMESN